MNEKNLEYLKNFLEKHGWDKEVAARVEKSIKAKETEFSVPAIVNKEKETVAYNLHFKKSGVSDMYFFNKFDATLKKVDEAQERTQSYRIFNGNNFNVQESFNLAAGRAIQKEMFTANGDRYEVFMKTDFSQKDDYQNYKMDYFNQKHGYDVEKALEKFPIKELANPELKWEITNALKAGEQVPVTMDIQGKEVNMLISMNPRFRTLNVSDEKGVAVKREQFQKKDLSQADNLDKDKSQNRNQSKSKGMSV